MHVRCVLIGASNLDASAADDIRQFERIIYALIRLCVLRSTVIELVG